MPMGVTDFWLIVGALVVIAVVYNWMQSKKQ